jgi:hypothetical protein
MLRLNNADKEILEILKEVFQPKRVNPLKSDDNMRLWLIRSTFLVSVISLLARLLIAFNGHDVTAQESAMFNMPFAYFFTVLFLHINNKSESTSRIIIVLTWVSLMISLYV